MTTQLTDLYTALFDALEALDQQLDGYGLYAIREHQKAGEVCFAVAAEKDSFPDPQEAPAFFLGVFHGDRHDNLGLSVDWGDLDKFTHSALEIVGKELHVEIVS